MVDAAATTPKSAGAMSRVRTAIVTNPETRTIHLWPVSHSVPTAAERPSGSVTASTGSVLPAVVSWPSGPGELQAMAAFLDRSIWLRGLDSSPQVLHRLEREGCTVELGVDIRGQADVHLRKVLRDDLGWNRSDVVDRDYYVVNAIRASAPHPWGPGSGIETVEGNEAREQQRLHSLLAAVEVGMGARSGTGICQRSLDK